MSELSRYAAPFPEHLQPETMATMPLDEPRYIEPQQIYGDDDGRVYLFGKERIPRGAATPSLLRGQLAVMLVMRGFDVCHVADMRYVAEKGAEDEHPDFSPQDFNYWEDAGDDGGLPVVAIMKRDPDTGDDDPVGDPDFFDAARHLARLVDKARREQRRKQLTEEPPFQFSWSERLIHIPMMRLAETFRPRR